MTTSVSGRVDDGQDVATKPSVDGDSGSLSLLSELQSVWLVAAPLFGSVRATADAELRLNRMALTQLALVGGVALAVALVTLFFVNAFMVAGLAQWLKLSWPVALFVVATLNGALLWWLIGQAQSLRGHLGFDRSRADIRRAFAAISGDDPAERNGG